MKITKEAWAEAHDLSVEMIKFVEGKETENKGVLLLALAISYSTYAKAVKMPIHNAIDLVMTIYKNTEIIDE